MQTTHFNIIDRYINNAMKLCPVIKKLYLFISFLAISYVGAAQIGPINVGLIPKNKTVKIVYDATVNNGLPATVCSVSNQGTVSGSNFSNVLTDDPDVAGAPHNPAIPTVTGLEETVAPQLTCPGNITVANTLNQCSAIVNFTGANAATATDNCGVPVITYSPVSGTSFTVGQTLVTVTATDASGNTSTCTFTVTVNDTQAPSITCPQNIIVLTDAGVCTASNVVVGTATALDNCPGVTVNGVRSDALALSAPYPKGVTTITWTATDASSNSVACSQTVTVNDNQLPSITCPTNVTVSTDAGQCSASSANVNGGVATSTDNCSGTTVTGIRSDALALSAAYPKGVTTITWKALDASGNSATCNQTITVNDTEKPTITCPSNIVIIENPAGSGSIVIPVANLGSPTTSDNCPGETWARTGVPAANTYPVGVTLLTYTATDASGNTQTCQQTVTVNSACQVICPGNIIIDAEAGTCGATVTYSAATTTGICGPLTYSHASGSVFNVGVTTVTVSSASTGQSCTFTVTVQDKQKPTISCPANQTVLLDATCAASLPDYTSLATKNDNCASPGPVTVTQSPVPGSSVTGIGSLNVILTATDPSGNTETCSFTVTKVDNIPPSISCGSTINVNTTTGQCSAIVNVSSTISGSDNCVGITNSGVRSDALALSAPYPKGTTTIIWTATDGSGNTATCQQTIIVNDVEVPTVNCPSNIVVSTDANQCYATVNAGVATGNDNCSGVTVTGVRSDAMALNATYPKGITTITWKATDASGNIATCNQTITVNDTQAPSIACPATQGLVLNTACGASLPDYRSLATKSDNCTAPGSITITQSPAINSPVSGTGSVTVTLTVTDASGNSSTCNFTVNKIDNTPPSITCPATQTLVLGSSCSATLPNYTSLAIKGDNCTPTGSITVTQSPAVSTVVSGTGSVMVTLTATDASGNISTCEFTVNKVDNTPPSIACPATQTLVLGTTCSATIPDYRSLAIKSDNCTAASSITVTQSPVPGSTVSNTGSITVTLTASDASGNTASCSFNVLKVDNTKPVITCPTNVTVNATPGQCSAVVSNATIGMATATDNCTVPVVSHNPYPAGNVFPVGVTNITWTATDASGNASTCIQTITVNDVEPPVITGVSVSQATLWPPNHQMRDVTVYYSSTDFCGLSGTCTLSVSSNEPINGTGDGDTSPDWIIVNDHQVKLRAERAGNGNGRVYTITITCTDGAGNSTSKTVNVVVAHNISAPISGAPFKVGSTVGFSGVFWDKLGNTHTSKWLVDNSIVANGIVTEPSGNQNGKVTGNYKFTSPGVYKMQMNVTDQNGITSYANTNGELEAIVVIYYPRGGYTYGGGWYQSVAGALVAKPLATGKASYGFSVNYTNASKPKGETQFEFKVGDFEFNALNFDYLVVSGARAQFKGTGKVTGDQSGYNFIMTVVDGALDGSGVDKVRMKIFKNNGQLIYDNQQGSGDAADPVTAVGSNSTIFILGTPQNRLIAGKTETENPEIVAPDLSLIAYPNPSKNDFTVQVMGDASKGGIMMQIVDQYGRILESYNRVVPGQLMKLGTSYKTGAYFIKISQGKMHKELKLIKLSE